jgi:glycosyltransferase involved in cell wall biosynthesis
MEITVILCTYNRCASLETVLNGLAAEELPPSIEWEVLVVDNNSSDRTRNVVEGYCRRYPRRFRYLFESQPGKSHALNAGIRDVQSRVLAFVDDDIVIHPGWLWNLTAPLIQGDYAGVGGRILPDPSFTPPNWMPIDEIGGSLAFFDHGDEAKELTEPPFGTNMAFLMSMFEKHGGFRIDLGPRPDGFIRNEDTEFGRRLITAGERLRYEPAAIIYHPVPSNRAQKEYFLEWYFDFGRARVREWAPPSTFFGVPRRCLTLLKIAGIVIPQRTLLWLLSLNPRRRFFRKLWVRVAAGELVEIYHEWRSQTPTPAPAQIKRAGDINGGTRT